jgi:hypothetical protein
MNYELMMRFQKSIDNNIKTLQEYPGSKFFVKILIQLQDTSRSYWSRAHSQIKTMTDEPSEGNIAKSKDVIQIAVNMNLEINNYLDKLMTSCFKRYEKGNTLFMDYLVHEIFYSYYLFLDALHNIGLCYILCQSFPLDMSNYYTSRKIEEFSGDFEEEEED